MDYAKCWLTEAPVPDTLQTPPDAARWELARAGLPCTLTVNPALQDSYTISADGGEVTGGETGVLYGVYRLVEWKRAGRPLPQGTESPAFTLRMLDHWDAMQGHVERGYAGRSIFFENGDFRGDDERLRAYARLLASVAINAISLNNVNVVEPAQELIGERFLPEGGARRGYFPRVRHPHAAVGRLLHARAGRACNRRSAGRAGAGLVASPRAA